MVHFTFSDTKTLLVIMVMANRTELFAMAVALLALLVCSSFGPGPVSSQVPVTTTETFDAASLLEQRFANLLTTVGLTGPLTAAAFNNPVLIPTTDSLTLASVTDAQRYSLYAAGAIYCYGSDLLTTWTCDYCKALGPNVRFYSTIYNETTRVAGMINIDDVVQEIVVTFRGSYAPPNFVSDATVTAIPFRGVNPNVLVHQGQLEAMESIYDQLKANLEALNTEYPNYRNTFTGHSLGSNIATLALLKIASEPEFSTKTFAHFSYGGPRVGNAAFAQWVNAMDFSHARVVRFGDLAPHMYPQTSTYTHFGTEFWIDGLETNNTRICGRDVTEDPTCSNSLAPLYDMYQHLSYYGVLVAHCAQEDPENGFAQTH